MTAWQPHIGAIRRNGVTFFRVWAPSSLSVAVEVQGASIAVERRPLSPAQDGWFTASFDDLPDDTRYGYLLDGLGPFPDPASRYQPDGVHGPSLVVDPTRFHWTDEAWSGLPLADLAIYELHVGTFTASGTFDGVAERIADLRALGITAIEIMPVADFPGTRNWGYDGVALFAPARAYGHPDDLRRLVDAAHGAGLAVILDVVYNHTGPDGSYLSRFSPFYFSARHQSPWGAGMNFDDEHSVAVREFFIENALHWVHEYHIDGLRLDATHAMQDESHEHFVAALSTRVKDSAPGRRIHVIAEDHRNLAQMIRPRAEGGWGLDAVWADDFHHHMRRLLAGDSDGYYRDYSGTTADIATTIRQGWFFTGQRSEHLGHGRGTDPAGLGPSRFVLSLQNHDQIGNRAFGERLHHEIPPSAFRAASVLFLLLPHTPLLFMGQEWAASSPFRYFTDHGEELGRLVTEGRRREFGAFAAFADSARREAIPDPQALETFEVSRLDWAERDREPGASMLRLHRAVLQFRRLELAAGQSTDASTAWAPDADTVAFCRTCPNGDRTLIVARLRGAGVVDLRGDASVAGAGHWDTVLTSEDADFAPDAVPPTVDGTAQGPVITFGAPAAVVMRRRAHTHLVSEPRSRTTGGTRAAAGGTARVTYRLQLHQGFDFTAAREVLPYLSALGVTDCYLSPISRAQPGSTHGYDVCRHAEISPELGGEDAFARFSETAATLGLGLVLDFVPNHMSNDPHTNDWWRDVLENGPSSPFARYFDIDWAPTKLELKNRLLLPILGEPYGQALERGALTLRFDSGTLVLDVGDYHLPINPRRSPLVYEHDLEALEQTLGPDDADLREFLSVLTALRNLPAYTERDERLIAERHREKEVARARLARVLDASPVLRAHVANAVAAFNGSPGDPRSFDRLHDLLEQQAYRLASWRTAADEINYRRFFDINTLAGLRVEDPQVFTAIHSLLLRLVATGAVTGVRLDHVDGLHDPGTYLVQLAAAVAETTPERASGGVAPPFLVVEKILTGTETLRREWPVAGTTGYTFLNLVNGVFVDGRSGKRLQRLYASVTGQRDPFVDVAYDSKRLIVYTALSSEFQVLAQAVNRFSEQDRRYRDFTLASIRRALRELVACFPVYRTYVGAAGATALDADVVDRAIADARRRNPAMESSIFDFLRFVLLPDAVAADAPEAEVDLARARNAIAMRFQQYTAPVQAKGVEDTAFYRYHVLTSLNEVGGDPARIGRSVAEFHRWAQERQRLFPGELLATTTHDTKRSEDARARINVISEVPQEWRAAVGRWHRLNAGHRTRHRGVDAPDANDEYLFYQTLLSTWPADALNGPHAQAPQNLADRVQAFMQKAIKEAKLHTSWITPNVDYETAVTRFVDRTLTGPTAEAFLASFVPFVSRVSHAGVVNSLAQQVLKLACPGVPDIYQGTELWDLSLVDPDNRRPVDFALRGQLLESFEPYLDAACMETGGRGVDLRSHVDTLLREWPTGHVKLYVTALLLRLRRQHPAVFAHGRYVPLDVTGERSSHVIAFARHHGDRTVVVVVPRLTVSLSAPDQWPAGALVWTDTAVTLSWPSPPAEYRNLFTGETVAATLVGTGSTLAVRDVLSSWPIAVLSTTTSR